jgi:hypothetical protein
MNYYYLGASLPGVSMDAKPSISLDEFRRLASEHLTSADLTALGNLESIWNTEPQHPFVKTWKDKETALRNSLVALRAQNIKTDPSPYLRQTASYDSAAEHAVSEAASRSNPLEKEQVLDRHRWAVLDDMAGFNSFASEAILAYSIKLSIAQRWSDMDAELGSQCAEQVISNKTAPGTEPQDAISENNENSE